MSEKETNRQWNEFYKGEECAWSRTGSSGLIWR